MQVRDLAVQFHTDEGVVRAVRGVSFDVRKGQTIGIVGESGSGKSVANLALLGLIPQPPGRITAGSAHFDGVDLLHMKTAALAAVRGRRIAMVFQDPMTSLNPFLTIAQQLTEVTIKHLGHTKKQARSHAIRMLDDVGIPSAASRIDEYPHEFSGGMRQRVMIAMALSCDPELLIADEPTTALDVNIQCQILELMQRLQKDHNTAIIFISHDMGVIAETCHDVMVMYAGRVVEMADVRTVFNDPRHPYTAGLLDSVARLDGDRTQPLRPVAGQPPDLTQLEDNCAFHPRCPFQVEKCVAVDPPLARIDGGAERHFACHVDIRSAERREVIYD